MKETTINLLSEVQANYLKRILADREHWKARGRKYVTVEKSIIDGEYKVFLLTDLMGYTFDNEIIDYVEL